jgi:protein TonB
MNSRIPESRKWLLAVGGSLLLHVIGLAGFGTWAQGRAPVLMPDIKDALRPVRVALAEPPPVEEAPPPEVAAPTPAPRATPPGPGAVRRHHPVTSRPAPAPRLRRGPAPTAPPPPAAKAKLPPEALRPSPAPPAPDAAELLRPSLPAENVIESAGARPSPSIFDLGAGPGGDRHGDPAGVPGGVPGGSPGGVVGGIPGGRLDGAPEAPTTGRPGGSSKAADGVGEPGGGSPPPAPRSTAAKTEPPPPIVPAQAISTPPCAYPESCRRKGLAGTVRLRLHIGRDGRVGNAEVVKSAGDRRLDQAAIKVVHDEWRFTPARQGDVPIEATCVATIRFILD